MIRVCHLTYLDLGRSIIFSALTFKLHGDRAVYPATSRVEGVVDRCGRKDVRGGHTRGRRGGCLGSSFHSLVSISALQQRGGGGGLFVIDASFHEYANLV